MEYAKYAEEKGFEAVWQAESRLVRDAIVPMAAYAAVTNTTQGRLGRDQQLDPQHRSAGRHLPDAG
ncbi:MAG: LLM class flavin-dependent oxidoreductase [Marinilabiliales bacterium]|nr:LLM class flavin-dependent oxidoreductase [Marinilabiliales bacterium]